MSKEDNDKLKQLRDEKSYYKGLSELYYYRAADELKLTHSIMIMQGCVMEMQSDLIAYKILHGETESFNKSWSRLEIFLNELSKLSAVQSENYILRKLVKDQRIELNELANKAFDTVKKSPNEGT